MSKHILIVEADKSNRELLELAIELPGYSVRTATSEYEVLVQLVTDMPDALVVGDLEPSPMTSLSLVSDIRGEGGFPQLPILMLSVCATPGTAEVCLAAGANRFLGKPYTISTIVATIDELLDSSTAA